MPYNTGIIAFNFILNHITNSPVFKINKTSENNQLITRNFTILI